MASPPNLVLLTLTLTLTLIHFHVATDAGLVKVQTRVQIGNEINDVNALTVHCKSKNDDLGEHEIYPNDSWSFQFTPNLWPFESTLFFCHMTWFGGGTGDFDIYVQKRDEKRCDNCSWIVRPDGPCVCNDNVVPCKALGTCYNWKNMTESYNT